MLTEVDRLQVVVADRRDAVERYERLFDACRLKEDRVACLGAQRTLLRLGASEGGLGNLTVPFCDAYSHLAVLSMWCRDC